MTGKEKKIFIAEAVIVFVILAAILLTQLIGTVEAAFQELSEAGLLRHGSGLFDYGTFQIHL